MKKAILILAAALALVACNKKQELGPEYRTGVEFSEVEYSSPIAGTDVEVSATITSLYGIFNAWVDYQLNDDPEATHTEVKPYEDSSKRNVTWHYSATIPSQPAGTKVSFRIFAYTPFGVLSASGLCVYTVTEEGNEQ